MLRWLTRRREVAPVEIEPMAVDEPRSPAGFQFRAADDEGFPIWPDDPDEVPAWRLEREAWAAAYGVSLPSYRTRREMESAIRASELADAGFEPMPLIGPFTPDEAAVQFLAYLQSHGVRQEYSAADINDVYLEYCSTQNIAPSPVDFVKAALALLPAVSKRKVDRRVEGRRQRVVCWVIEPRLAPASSAVLDERKPALPLEPEPIRLAA